MKAGANHGLIVDIENNLYTFGKNTIGQLGLGHCISTQAPERVELNLA